MRAKYYVIDYSETGIGRIFYYSAGGSPEVLKNDHEMSDDFWDYMRVGVRVYDSYTELCDMYKFMPRTPNPPSHMHIRWIS